jgi:ATP-binding cassette subfamily B protein
VLDDPFSALDRNTEQQIFANLRAQCKGSTLLYLSHRMELFPQMDQVLLFQGGRVIVSTHAALLSDSPEYAQLVALSRGKGEDHEA